MQIELTPTLERLIAEKVESGFYRDAGEVVREALRLLERLDRGDPEKLAELREEIQRGLDDYAAGRFTVVNDEAELAQFFADL